MPQAAVKSRYAEGPTVAERDRPVRRQARSRAAWQCSRLLARRARAGRGKWWRLGSGGPAVTRISCGEENVMTMSVVKRLAHLCAGALLIWIPACSSTRDGSLDRRTTTSREEAMGTVTEALSDGPGTCTSATFGTEVYYFCSNAPSWTAARSQCLSKVGLDLVRIDGTAENAFVASKISGETWLS